MLLFDRGIDEALWIGNTVVRVLEIRDGEVRLAISSTEGPRYQEVVLNCASLDQLDGLAIDSRDESLSFFA